VKFVAVQFVFILFLLPVFLSAQSINIIPLPKSVFIKGGQFQLNSKTVIGVNNSSLLPQANFLQKELLKIDSLAIPVDQNEGSAVIDLKLIQNIRMSTPGSYFLNIEAGRVTISSASNEGIFYGMISLLRLIKDQAHTGALNLPLVDIADEPRYQWRGFMLDESRHFFGREKVKQLLDWMAYYKLNKFHWHLSDVNGWRIEIKKYPKLATVGGMGNYSDTLAEAKYYTQQEIREIVAYASERFITVIPEIDMPGHATAANRAYPEFSGGSVPKYPNFTFDPANEKTYQYLADIIKETDSLFPSQMLHLGGDEVELGIQAWAQRPAIKDMLLKNNFTSLTDLEHYFFRRMADTVISLNNKVLCWDEAVEAGLPADKTIIFWWRQNFPGQLQLALQKKYQVVLCPRLPLYFDFVQDNSHVAGRKWIGRVNSVSDVYNFPDRQVAGDQLSSTQILGIQANVWTEMIGSEKRLDFMIYPRMAALAEAAWTNSSQKNETSFNERLKEEFKHYDAAGIYYYNPFDATLHPEVVDFAPRIVIHHTRAKHRRGHRSGKQHAAGHRKHKGSAHSKHSAKAHHSKAGKRKRR
jgi:hexosaminidase